MSKDENTYIFGEPELWPHYAKYAALLVAVAMTGVTLFFTWWTFRPIAATITSPHTETTKGKITKFIVRKLPQTTQLAPTQCVELEYVYSVGGKDLASTRYQPTDTGLISGLILPELIKNYHLGDRVTVYYDPADASDAVLKPAHFERDSIIPLISVVILTSILWIVFVVAP